MGRSDTEIGLPAGPGYHVVNESVVQFRCR